MPALKPTNLTAEIMWLGLVPNPDTIRAAARQTLTVGWDGPDGEAHGGRTRKSCVRVSAQHQEGTEIANVRQFSVLSQEELDLIATDCGLDSIDPIWLGATLVIKGIPDFSHVPPSSRLQAADGTTLVIDMENRPCRYPGDEIEKDVPGKGAAFKGAAKGRRGVTAWVERPGTLQVGDMMRLHVPDQPLWTGGGFI